MKDNIYTYVKPTVALREAVVFPKTQLNFDVGRKKSIAAIKSAMKENDREVFLVTQRELDCEEPDFADLYSVGTVAKVHQIFRLPGTDIHRVSVEGLYRARLVDLWQSKPFLKSNIKKIEETRVNSGLPDYEKALVRRAREMFKKYVIQIIPSPEEFLFKVRKITKIGEFSDYIADNLYIDYAEKQKILAETDQIKRMELVCQVLTEENNLLDLENTINQRVQEHMDKNQHEYYLREQMKVIGDELGDGESPEGESEKYRQRIHSLNLEEKTRTKLLREVDRFATVPVHSPESAVIRSYIDTCLDLPWNTKTKDNLNIQKAKAVLEKDHYGMEKIKERIIQALAVKQMAPDIKGQIICLAGPPGVGKTSVAKSIAKAMNRKFVRISLGGIRDEAEIRGHRKTYIGAMPGRIINALTQAGTNNPVILLDEIDKLGADYKGDPSAALLEVLDGEQNNSFCDHYIDVPFDLSNVMFITTANDQSSIPAPLLDRMEIIEMSSYTPVEKFNIAKGYLIPKQVKAHGLNGRKIKINDLAVNAVIAGYTRESGVRKLERCIAEICRKAVVEILDGKKSVSINENNLTNYLGTVKYFDENEMNEDEVGVANGLAWTAVGGEMLQVEALEMNGSGSIELTGNLGDVMKESAVAAMSYIRSISDELGIEHDFHKDSDVHIHVPDGAVPKDGPSAGVTMATAIASALSGRRVDHTVAMTGEITLRGRVLPIGGLKEKSMAAYTAGIKTVMIPQLNVADLDEVDDVIKKNIEFIPVKHMNEILERALLDDTKVQNTIKPPALAANSQNNWQGSVRA